MIDNITFPYKTALSEANVKTDGMGSFVSNDFPFLEIFFQFRDLVYGVDLM